MNDTTKHFVLALYYYNRGNPIYHIHLDKAKKSVQLRQKILGMLGAGVNKIPGLYLSGKY